MKKLTAKNLKAALPHIFLATWEAQEYIDKKLIGAENLEEAIVKAQKWHDKIKAEVARAFENDEIDF